jgi:hypothetical protein
MNNTVLHNKELCYLNNMLGYKQLRKLILVLIRETRNDAEVWFGKVMENSCFKETDKRTTLKLILGKRTR